MLDWESVQGGSLQQRGCRCTWDGFATGGWTVEALLDRLRFWLAKLGSSSASIYEPAAAVARAQVSFGVGQRSSVLVGVASESWALAGGDYGVAIVFLPSVSCWSRIGTFVEFLFGGRWVEAWRASVVEIRVVMP